MAGVGVTGGRETLLKLLPFDTYKELFHWTHSVPQTCHTIMHVQGKTFLEPSPRQHLLCVNGKIPFYTTIVNNLACRLWRWNRKGLS